METKIETKENFEIRKSNLQNKMQKAIRNKTQRVAYSLFTEDYASLTVVTRKGKRQFATVETWRINLEHMKATFNYTIIQKEEMEALASLFSRGDE